MLSNKCLRIFTGLLLVITFAIGCTFAPASYEQTVRSAVNSRNVYIDVRENGTVILTGWVEDYYARNRVAFVASQGEGITRVINRLRVEY